MTVDCVGNTSFRWHIKPVKSVLAGVTGLGLCENTYAMTRDTSHDFLELRTIYRLLSPYTSWLFREINMMVASTG